MPHLLETNIVDKDGVIGMDNKTLGVLLTNALNKLGFKNYGPRLFYIEFEECIVVLNQITYMTAAELYLDLIIKQCHPEIEKITKNVITDRMLLDSYNYNRLYHFVPDTLNYDFYSIPEEDFDNEIKKVYDVNVRPFSQGVVNGIKNLSKYHAMIELFKDSAEKIGFLEFAGYRGHEWLLTDEYRAEYDYGVDSRFINKNTAGYIMENVISALPTDLKGKARSKWCNERCKEIFLKKGKRISLGFGILFPIVNGKPLKYCGCSVIGPHYEIYYNEDTGETFHYKRVKIKDSPVEYKYEITKAESK